MNKSVLLIISGGVAAYKALTVIRDLAKIGIKSKVILTKGGSEFVTPLSIGALSGNKVYTDLWSLTDSADGRSKQLPLPSQSCDCPPQSR